ncbi:MAG: glycerol-3-phosphate 1-O-acyltransferase PlsY [Verrucomicrobia bacterium]|nr:glycerol-3-phosphate 1-O-acyltransferase PlsY [Verrucomicrobiota bacterium]
MAEIRDWIWIWGACLLPAYFVGSIPWGYLFGLLKGLDIRQHGSGNIGATNVWRVLGRNWGIATFILDFFKAPAAVVAVAFLESHLSGPRILSSWAEASVDLVPLVGAVLGHNYPCWLKFKGGKGIATSAGGLLWLMPKGFLVGLMIWIAVFAIWRYVSLASITGCVALPVAAWIFYRDHFLWIGICCFLSVMAVWRHRENIRRLIQGTEHRWKSEAQITSRGTRDADEPQAGTSVSKLEARSSLPNMPP